MRNGNDSRPCERISLKTARRGETVGVMTKKALFSVVALAAGLALAGCADGPVEAPDGPGPTVPATPAGPTPSNTPNGPTQPATPPPLSLPSPDVVTAMDCGQIEAEVIAQLQALPHVTAASAVVDGTTCHYTGPAGGDMPTPPSLAVTMAGGVSADQLAATHGSIHAIHAAYIAPVASDPEIIRIDVDGVLEVEWQGPLAFDATLAQEMLDVTGPGRYLAARLVLPPWELAGSSVLDEDASFVYLYVAGGGAATAEEVTGLMDAGWTDAQGLQSSFDTTVALGLVDEIAITAEGDGIIPGPGRASFLVDVPTDGSLPAEFGAIALRTLDLADQPELKRSEVYLRSFQPYAWLNPLRQYDDISAESQEILDDIAAQLEAAGYELEAIHTS